MSKNNTKILGMITLPINKNNTEFFNKGDSVLTMNNIELFKGYNIKILPIPYNTTNYNFYFNKIHALYIPGDTLFTIDNNQFYKTILNLINLAKKANDNGIYFPVYGVCKGMEYMLIVENGFKNLNIDFLEKFNSFNKLFLPLNILPEKFNSRIIKYILINNKIDLYNLLSTNSTLHNHNYGMTPTKFNKFNKLTKFYNIIATSKDRDNKEFISIIEAYKYPFYGVQFHPENIKSQKYFASFLVSEINKNITNIIFNKKDILKYNTYSHCYDFDKLDEIKCRFYKHN
jgi:gamma-glutamyl hydrolase